MCASLTLSVWVYIELLKHFVQFMSDYYDSFHKAHESSSRQVLLHPDAYLAIIPNVFCVCVCAVE